LFLYLLCGVNNAMNSKERFLAACARKGVDRPPVWLMRQAGRYLPEYRSIRANYDFLEMCKTPSIACEISLQPWLRYHMDAVIVFSDILFIPEALGLTLTFRRDEGPKLSPLLKNTADVDSLKKVDAEKAFDFVYSSLKLVREKLPKDVPLIGFSGAPWTLAYYMTGDRANEWIPKDKEALKKLLSKITDVVIDYVKLQQKAGADVIQIFDTWAGELSREDFTELALPCLKRIVSEGKVSAPFIIYCRKCHHILNELADTGADAISIDPDTPIEEAIKVIGDRVAIQGNLDPKLLTTTEGFVRQEVSRLLSKIKGRNGHIINLGHGILQTSNVECVESFVETVKHSL